MNQQTKRESLIDFEKHPESFPDHRMMPSGWHLSENVISNGVKAEEKGDSFPDFIFPEPRTIPTGWNF